MNSYILASLGIQQEYNAPLDVNRLADADGAIWQQVRYSNSVIPHAAPRGTTPVALANGELIGWSRYQIAKCDRFIAVMPLPTTMAPGSMTRIEESNIIQLEVRLDSALNPTLVAPSRAAVTDVRYIVLFRDPPALKTSAQLYGSSVWFELSTEKFFTDDSHRNNIPRDVIEHYLMIGAKYGQYRNAPAPLHGGAAQGTSGSARAYYGAARPPAKPTTTFTVQSAAAQQAAAPAGLNPWTVYPTPRPKLPRADPVVGEVVAWRAWALTEARSYVSGNLLTSVYQTAIIWKPKETLKSKPPTDYGDIGIHAHKTRETLLKYVGEAYSTKLLVIGRVRLWGEAVEGETGYRAEFAQVESLEEILRPKFARWSKVDWDGNPCHMSPGEESVNNQQLLDKLREVYGVN